MIHYAFEMSPLKKALGMKIKHHEFKILKWTGCTCLLFIKTLTSGKSLSFSIPCGWFLKAKVPLSWVEPSELRKSRDHQDEEQGKGGLHKTVQTCLESYGGQNFGGVGGGEGVLEIACGWMHCVLGSETVGNWIKSGDSRSWPKSHNTKYKANNTWFLSEKLRSNGITQKEWQISALGDGGVVCISKSLIWE